jgi:hypothetical protein
VAFPNAGIQILQPDGFEVGEKFDGFVNLTAGAIVMVRRASGSYKEALHLDNTAEAEKAGLRIVSQKAIESDGLPGALLYATHEKDGRTVSQWIGAFQDGSFYILVAATFPAEREAELSDRLRDSAIHVRRDSTPPPPDSGLPFNVQATAKLRRTPSLGKMIGFTRDGIAPPRSPEDPGFVVAPSLTALPASESTADRQMLAVQRLQTWSNMSDISLTGCSPIRLDGLDGYEISATARDTKSGARLSLYQVMLFDEVGYIILKGRVAQSRSGEYVPEFKTIARSFKRKRHP